MTQKSGKELLKPIGDIIISYRKDQRYTQKQLAKKGGISYITIFNLETGKVDSIQMGTLIKVLNACDRTLDRLI